MISRDHARLHRLHEYEDMPVERTAEARHQRRSRRWMRPLSVLFGIVVAGLLVWAATKVDWPEVWQALRRMPPAALLAGLAAAVTSHIVYSTYDLLGKAWTGHRLPWPKVMQTTFVSYAFTLSLGSLVGGIALRLRLYSRMGLGRADIGRVTAMSMLSNWLGYALLAGTVFLLGWLQPPPEWSLSMPALRAMGAAMLAVVGAYVAYCAFAKRRRFRLRGHAIVLPPGRLAAMQLLPSALNWLLMAVTLWLLLQRVVPFPHVLGALLAGAIAGVLTHVPAGAGVLEAVVITLTPNVPAHTLLAGLLAYRAIYYLLPLAVAAVWYAVMESKGRRHLDTRHG